MQLTFVLVLEKWCFFDGFSAAPDAVLRAIRSWQLCAILIEHEDEHEHEDEKEVTPSTSASKDRRVQPTP
jgi:hypothetical protein